MVVAAFNQEKALGASRGLLRDCTTSPMDRFTALILILCVCRYCGQVLGNKLAGPILSFSKPFVVRTKTDSAEPHGGVAINNRGYRLTYKQIPCSVERPNAAAFA